MPADAFTSGDRLTTIDECTRVPFSTFRDERGELMAVEESPVDLPFLLRRTYFLRNVPRGSSRAGHAHLFEHEVMCALAGSFHALLDDGERRVKIELRPGEPGLYVPPGIWHRLESFAPGSICAVFSSHLYDPADYVRSYESFLAARGC